MNLPKNEFKRFSLPPSASAVIKILEQAGGIRTSAELLNETQEKFSTRTLRYALKKLIDNDLIEKKPYLGDMRKTLYTLKMQREKLNSKIQNDHLRVV